MAKAVSFVSMVSILVLCFEIAFCSRVGGNAIPVSQSVKRNTKRIKDPPVSVAVPLHWQNHHFPSFIIGGKPPNVLFPH